MFAPANRATQSMGRATQSMGRSSLTRRSAILVVLTLGGASVASGCAGAGVAPDGDGGTSGGATATAGRWSWQLSANGKLQQQVGAFPDGTYTLSVSVKATGSGGQLMAKGCGGTDSTTPIPAGTSFTNVKSAPIAVSGGQCTVSVSAGSAQLTLDDFLLSDA
jgi:hypothetical protein